MSVWSAWRAFRRCSYDEVVHLRLFGIVLRNTVDEVLTVIHGDRIGLDWRHLIGEPA